MQFVYPPTFLSLRGSPNHGPGSKRVGPLQNAKSQHMRVPRFRAEGQPITGEGQECGLLQATCEFLYPPSLWLQPIPDEPKNQAPPGSTVLRSGKYRHLLGSDGCGGFFWQRSKLWSTKTNGHTSLEHDGEVEMSVHLPLVRNIGGMYNPLRCTIFF